MQLSPLIVLTLLTLPAEATAQEDAAGSPGAPPSVSTPSQAVLSPTGLTAPAGSLSFGSYEVAGFGVTYVPIDRLQLRAVGLIGPVVQADNLVPFRHLEAKLRLADWGRLHVALVGFASRIYARYTTYRTDGGGIVGTFCAHPDCSWAFSLAGIGAFHRTDGSTDDGGGVRSKVLVYTASAVGTLSRHWSVLLEAIGTGEVGCNRHCESDAWQALILSAGPRLSWRALTVDLALMLYAEQDQWEVTPLPWLAVSYRAL